MSLPWSSIIIALSSLSRHGRTSLRYLYMAISTVSASARRRSDPSDVPGAWRWRWTLSGHPSRVRVAGPSVPVRFVRSFGSSVRVVSNFYLTRDRISRSWVTSFPVKVVITVDPRRFYQYHHCWGHNDRRGGKSAARQERSEDACFKLHQPQIRLHLAHVARVLARCIRPRTRGSKGLLI